MHACNLFIFICIIFQLTLISALPTPINYVIYIGLDTVVVNFFYNVFFTVNLVFPHHMFLILADLLQVIYLHGVFSVWCKKVVGWLLLGKMLNNNLHMDCVVCLSHSSLPNECLFTLFFSFLGGVNSFNSFTYKTHYNDNVRDTVIDVQMNCNSFSL